MTDRSESTKVHQWRNMGMGWNAVAKALGRSVDYARQAHDPTYLKPAPPPPRPAKPRPNSGPGYTAHRKASAGRAGSRTQQFVVALYAADKPVPVAAFDFPAPNVVKSFRHANGFEVITGNPTTGYSLSAYGRAIAETRYGVGG